MTAIVSDDVVEFRGEAKIGDTIIRCSKYERIIVNDLLITGNYNQGDYSIRGYQISRYVGYWESLADHLSEIICLSIRQLVCLFRG